MSRERNSKTIKVAESKLVLGAEFLFTTFSFDLEVFCLALHQNFRIELFHLKHSLYIYETPHKKIKLLISKYKKFQIRNG